MPILRLATLRETRNPVRVQTWNATMRAGDDFKLALTVLNDDTGTPAVVLGSRSQLVLWPDSHHGAWNSWDYGLGWWTGATFGPGFPQQICVGFTTPVRPGGINFPIPSYETTNLQYGRYRLAIQVDLQDGEFCMVEGILQVRERWHRTGFLHIPATRRVADFTDDFNGDFPTPSNQLFGFPGAILVNGQPVDPDGFFLLTRDFRESPPPQTTQQMVTAIPDAIALEDGSGAWLWEDGSRLDWG